MVEIILRFLICFDRPDTARIGPVLEDEFRGIGHNLGDRRA